MRDGGYSTAKYWLSDGWATVQANNWTAPLYWELDDEKDENGHDRWLIFTLEGKAYPYSSLSKALPSSGLPLIVLQCQLTRAF